MLLFKPSGSNFVKVIVLAGGSGSRLWPFSRLSFPKQFLNMGQERSLLQQTVERLLPTFRPEDLIIIAPAIYVKHVKEQLYAVDPRLAERILIEKEPRNTAPAILLAVKYWQSCGVDDEEPILTLPSDHRIGLPEAFLESLFLAESFAKQKEIVLFGVIPTHPETAYGYLKVEKRVNSKALHVEKFIEKPCQKIAQELFSTGQYLWNAGIFMFTAEAFWKKIRVHADDLALFESYSFKETEDNFAQMKPLSIDYALMEKLERLTAVALDCEWSDMGSWDTVFAALDKDFNQNVKIGNVVDIDTKNSFILGGKRVIATIGVEDLLVIETEDAIFLGKKGESQRMKSVIEQLIKQGRHDIL